MQTCRKSVLIEWKKKKNPGCLELRMVLQLVTNNNNICTVVVSCFDEQFYPPPPKQLATPIYILLYIYIYKYKIDA